MESFTPSPLKNQSLPESKDKMWVNFIKRHLMATVFSITALVATETATAQEGKEKQPTHARGMNLDSLERSLKKDFSAFEKIVERDNIKEKLAYMESFFGEALGNFSASYRIHLDMTVFERTQERRNDSNVFVQNKDPYLSTPGLNASRSYNKRWKKPEPLYKPVAFKNIESIPGLSLKDVEKFLSDTYPKGYITGSVDSIEFINERNIQGNTEILGKAEGFNIFSNTGGLTNNIRIYNMGGELTRDNFFYILKHEIHHQNSWENSRLLSSSERISMLYDISQRIEAPDRYISDYVEGIGEEDLETYFKGKANATKEQYLNYIHANEYWPEIAKAYFDDQDKFKKDHPKDYAIVKKWVEKMTKK